MILFYSVILLSFAAGALLVLGLAATPPKRGIAARLEHLVSAQQTPQDNPGSITFPPQHPRRAALLRLGELLPASPALAVLLDQAGQPYGLQTSEFAGLRFISLAGFSLLALLSAHWLGTTGLMKAIAAIFILLIGFCLPDAWLHGQIRQRQAQARRMLPDLLDLLVVSMEAGASFDAATALAAHTMQGALPDELQRAIQAMQLGRTRAEALRDMAARLAVAEVTGFVLAIIQADRLGAGVAHVLRIQSVTARTRRIQQIREKTAQLPTQMLFPLVFFLLPALFVTIIGPGLINLLHVLRR